MKYLLMFIIVLCIIYMCLRSLVWAGHLMLWAMHLAFPVIVLLVCGVLLLGLAGSRRD